jgi:hypothetical protein
MPEADFANQTGRQFPVTASELKMSKREPKTLAEAIMLTAPPGQIPLDRFEANVKQFSDAQLDAAMAFVRELAGGDPPPSPIVAAARVFNRYWGQFRNREAN